MTEVKSINLYTKNHGKIDGIEDYIEILSDIVSADKGLNLVTTKKLNRNTPNIVIDEFTNHITNQEILDFKAHNPDAGLILVATEFPDQKYRVRSFNHFGGVIDASMLSAINIVMKYKRKDFDAVTAKEWIDFLLFVPLNLLIVPFIGVLFFLCRYLNVGILHTVKNKIASKIHKLSYNHMRFLGLSKFISLFDVILVSHENIERSMLDAGWIVENDPRVAGCFYPVVDTKVIEKNLFKGKSLGVEMTGTISNYRAKWIRKINYELIALGLHNTINALQTFRFGDTQRNEKTERSAFSLHPPQSKKWPYSSPTRLYRALQVDHNMPIITHDFQQNPTEDLCIKYQGAETFKTMYDFFESPDKALEYLAPKIKQYNDFANTHNTKIVNRIRQVI